MRLNLTALSRIGLILVCTLSSGVSTQAQLSPRLKQLRNITFDHVTSEQGLPSDVVTAIIEDSRGFMWFGTQNGLCRYDGYSMVIYKRNELDSTSISDNFVNRILEDADKRTIWVGTNNGLNAYDISTGKFTRFTPDSATPYSLTSPMVNGICQDHTGRLWVGTVKELSEIVVDSSGQVKVVQYMNFPKDTTSQSRDYIDEPREGDDGMIWFATRGLVRFDPETKQFTRFLFSAEGAPTPSVNRIIAIEKDRKGNFWAGTYHGVIRFDTRTTSFEQIGYDPANPHSLSRNEVKSLRIDESGTLWVGTAGSGLYALDTATGQQIRFSHNPPRPGGLSNDFLDGLCRDRRGSLWVATSGGGINKYDKDRNQCIHIRNEPGNRNSLTDDNVFEMVEDNRGAVWIATSAGLNVYDPRTGNFNHYLHNPSNERSLSDPFVSSLYKDSDGTIWAGTYEGLNRIDPLTGIVTRYYNEPAPPHHSPMNKITAIHRDRSGTLWVATMNGPKTVNLKEKRFEGYLYYEWILQILGDRDGKSLWVGTKRAGLLKIDSKTRIVKQFSYDPHNPTSISHNSVCTLCEDPKEPQRILWIATLGGGLNRFDKSAGTFTRFTETDGLADNHIHSMAFDRRGNLWLGTGKGLSRFDPKTGVFKNYDARDGITNGEANHHGLLRASTGELYVGTPKGITIFHPDSLRDNPHIPPIVLTDFRITNKSVVPGAPHSPLSRTITETKEITLSYLDNMISIDFAALDFVMPGKNQYAYKLEGFDKDWIRSGNVHTATFTNLDPGKYTFRVKGSNNDGLWNEEGTSLSITITPPWWKATWAYFAYVVILGSVLYSAYRVRVNRLRLVHKLELQHLETTKMREVDELKSRFFTNISHEFRTPLTLILGPAKQLLEGSTDEVTKTKADLIHRSAGKLNRLVDELLDLARIEAGEMKLIARPINIVSAVHDLVLTYQSLAERKKIAFRCSCDQHEIVAYLDKNKAEKILTNVLSNAFKFTPEGGTVEVRITSGTSHRRDSVAISIADTGIGIPRDQLDKIFDRFYQVNGSHTREQEGTGIGLALTRELVELHKGTIEVESEEGKGATFRLTFPLGKAHLKPEEIGAEEEEHERERPIIQLDEGIIRRAEHGLARDLSEKSILPILLIIEDNSDVRSYIRSILENTYRTLEAKDGKEGLVISLECIPDLIITDIMMPEMDGFQLCGKLKADSRTSHIPVIMLTAKATSSDKISGLDVGADDYIMKPFEAPELTARIRNLIEQRKRLHEHFRSYGFVEMTEKNVTSVDQRFLRKAVEVVTEHIADTSFSVEVFADAMAVSRSLLFRKMEALLGEPPSELIKRTRLNKAANLLERKAGNVSEIALEVGFDNPSYFAECFRKQFGCTPTKYSHNRQHPRSGQAGPRPI